MLSSLKTGLLAASVLMAAGQVAAAQTMAVQTGSSPSMTGAAETSRPIPPRVDDSALRYYASQGQTTRVAAEARRLSRLFPDWHMPDDLYAARIGRADEGPLWSMFAENRLDELQAAIAARKADEPGWRPSDDLLDKMKHKALRAAIIGLARTGDWRAIVQHAKSDGVVWAQNDAEVLWMIGEALARQNESAEAFIVYRSILINHPDPAERIATIQRGIATIPMSYVEKLVALGHAGEGGRGEFESIAIDITRARMVAFLHDERVELVPSADLAAFEAAAKGTDDPNQSGLVAWYAFKRGDYRDAMEWFKLSIAHGGDAMIAHGLAHTLRKLGMMREAEEVAFAWREPLVNNAILYIDLLEESLTKDQPPFIEPERIARYAKVVVDTGSGEGAQALAWYAYNTCQYPAALEWFQRAVAWMPKEATAYGYALTLQRLKRGKEFREVVNRYDGLFPKVVALAFNDGRTTPPPPCEANLAVPSAPPRSPEGAPISMAVNWTGRTLAETLAPRAGGRTAGEALAAQYARARVPSPDGANGLVPADAPPLVKRTEFPVAVASENPLRFSSLRTVTNEEQGRPPSSMPLVARRVAGVGAMPYELYGFTLIAGVGGLNEPSSPAAAERAAPAGTLAALAQSLRDRGTVTDQREYDAAANAHAGASRVLTSGPSSGPRS